ncbi:MAG: SET domain-containing protein [Patescibacteria group bacterium]
MIGQLPHYQVYTRLKPSKIHGVGVFAIRHIPKGVRIFLGEKTQIVWIKESTIKKLSPEYRRLYDDFCLLKKGRLACPANFNQLAPGWYLNHSKKPNVALDKKMDFFTLRNIRKGEELTVDYTTYSEQPAPKK